MCGIAGLQGGFRPGIIDAMTAALAHRGPDGCGTVALTDGATWLGHRRLSIIDLSDAGRQPMTVAPDPGGHGLQGLTLVYNGEIYNYRELRRELERKGHRFHSATDSEVLLHLYESEGLEMLSRLNGIFALALHDQRPSGRPDGVDQGALLLARDPMGVKPLYFTNVADGFAFASEIKGLLSVPSLGRAVDAVAIHGLLAHLWTPAPRTALEGVEKLEPGGALIVHEGRVRRRWRYRTPRYEGRTRAGGLDAAAGELRGRLATAVERQLVADVPVGAFLSGGLDSSAVVAMARHAWPDRDLPCFTIRLGDGVSIDGAPDDLPFARRVARHLRVPLEEITLESDAIDALPDVVWWMDEPQGDPAPINALLIAERARAVGVPVLLSGAGGDDLFGGYRRHRALLLERAWRWLPRPARAALARASRAVAEGALPGQSATIPRRAAKLFAAADLEGDARIASYFQWSAEAARRSLYTPAFAERVGEFDSAAPLLGSLRDIPEEGDPLQRMLYLEARHFLADHNLNYTDRAGMAHGVEIRVPLLDLDLVDFATTVPARFKQKGSVGKAVFKRAMEPDLPADVIYRPKTGFGAPLRRWLRRELASTVDDTLGEETLRRRGLFEPGAVRSLIERDRAGRVDGAYLIFALMNLELWCRRFID